MNQALVKSVTLQWTAILIKRAHLFPVESTTSDKDNDVRENLHQPLVGAALLERRLPTTLCYPPPSSAAKDDGKRPSLKVNVCEVLEKRLRDNLELLQERYEHLMYINTSLRQGGKGPDVLGAVWLFVCLSTYSLARLKVRLSV